MTRYERHFDFEQVFNFRDLGGYRTADGRSVRWRRLFRTAEHQRMKPHEVERLRSEITLRTIIDFRSEGEANDPRGPGALVGPGVNRLHFGMGDARSKYEARESGSWHPDYRSLLDGAAGLWTRALAVLATEDAYPAVFHCVTGKDRTGVFAALILDLLGVDGDTIVEDYGLSQRAMDTMVERLRARGVIKPGEAINPALGVIPSAMADMLVYLDDRYGGARAFFRAQGIAPPTFDALEALLLEESPAS